MLIAKLPHRLREYRYHICHDDLDDTPLGFIVSLQFIPCWIKGTWNLGLCGRNWAEETIQTYTQDQVPLLRITGDAVSISELAWHMYRAEQVVDIAREVIGHHENFELAAELSLKKINRMVVKAIMANELNNNFHLELLQAEHFLLSVAPVTEKKE